MGFFRGPNIVRDGLVLALDAATKLQRTKIKIRIIKIQNYV
jgi:hypothetical protein